MHFSTKATYGLKAVLHLAEQHGQRAVSAAQISRSEGIPVPYLEQILLLLKRKKWVISLRGPSGGYVLSRKPSEIKVADILRDLEGGEFQIVKEETLAAGEGADRAGAASRLFWSEFTLHIADFVASRTLQDLINQADLVNNKKTKNRRLSFSI